jgi:hypothetical protein
LKISMKNIFALAILLFIFAASSSAQPQNYYGFYPYQTCSFSPSAGVILSGRIISTEFVKDLTLKQFSIYKSKVEVDKVFKGKPKKTIEILWGEDGFFFDLKKGDERIFIVNEVDLPNSRALLSRKWSLRLNNYTAREKDNIYSLINSRIQRFPKAPPLIGVVTENTTAPSNQSNKVFTNFGFDYTGSSLMKGITIEAKRETDGKIFRTKTNDNGFYVFDELTDGNYHVYPLFPAEYERVSQAYLNLIYRVDKDSCHDLAVFRLNKK